MFKRIYIFFFTYMAAMYFSQTLIIFWLFKNGYNFSHLIIFYVVPYIISLASIFLFSRFKFKAKSAILLGMLLSALSVLVLIKIVSPAQFYISILFTGLNQIFFWIPLNIMYFKYSSEEKRGLNSGIMFLITPIIGISLQPLAGIIAEKLGFQTMFLIGIFMYSIPIFLLKFIPNFEWNLDIKKELATLKFNWSTFFQGMASRINYSLIPVFTLFFMKTPSQFGNFFGYLAILAALASVINGHISDKIKNRKHFFYLFSSLAVLSFLPLAYVENPYYWGLFAGISSLCFYLANPFWLTYNLDYYKEIGVEKTMVLREVFMESGHIFSLLVVFLVFYFTASTKISLIVVCLIACLLPVVSYLQGVYRNKNNA